MCLPGALVKATLLLPRLYDGLVWICLILSPATGGMPACHHISFYAGSVTFAKFRQQAILTLCLIWIGGRGNLEHSH